MAVALSVVAARFCNALELLDARTVIAILLAPACVAAVTLGALIVARLDDEHSVVARAAAVARVALVVRAPPAECAICVAHADAPVALACGHAFHAACVSCWLELAPTCPLCRASATMR